LKGTAHAIDHRAMSVALLGPQRHRPTVRRALDRLGVQGGVALVSAGWQEREGEASELQEHLGRPVTDLALYRRADRVRADAPEIARLLRARQAAIQDLQAVYRVRLRHAQEAPREIRQSAVGERVRAAGLRAALGAVRRLDREHLRALGRVHRQTDRQINRHLTPLAREVDEIRAQVEGVGAILIAGGHVAVLLNRLRLFDAAAWLSGRPVVAWAAGAMVLTERIVLFNDHPPQGAGDAELLDAGLGLVAGVVALPDAAHRLDLHDEARVGTLAARFAPSRPLTLDDGSLVIEGAAGSLFENVLELDPDGGVAPARPA
jgi:hypothetical protein